MRHIVHSIERLVRLGLDIGFDAIRWLWRYFLLGAVIVIPIWLIIAPVSTRRAAATAAACRASCSRVTNRTRFRHCRPGNAGQSDDAAARRASRTRRDRPARRCRALLGGVAMASLVFDCMFWLFGFLRMGTIALTAQACWRR